jgi:hypothetical protein
MSKILWHSLTIKVPAEMVTYTPKGKVSVKKTLTKMNNIATSQKKPAIKIIPSPDNNVHVIEGKQWDPNELQETLKKVNKMEAKNKGRVLSMTPKIFASKVATRARELVKKKKEPKKEPKKKRETEESIFETYSDLRPEDVQFILDNEADNDAEKINFIRKYLSENKFSTEITKDDKMEEVEYLFTPKKSESVKLRKWKDDMRQGALDMMHNFLYPNQAFHADNSFAHIAKLKEQRK